jgi:lysozyme family protein
MSGVDFARALPRILVYEGGKVDNPKDPGGRTNQGVTQATYNAWRRERNLPGQDVYLMAPAERDTIYKTHYWDVILGDQLPVGLDLCVFDAAVNSGPGHAGVWLQQALGDAYRGPIDGLIGAKTLQAIQDHGDPEELIADYCAHRLGTLKELATWGAFGRGWSARIANVQKTADAWDMGDDAPAAIDVASAGGHMKAPVGGNIKPAPISQAATHAATAVATAGTVATSAVANLQPVHDAFPGLRWLAGLMSGLTALGVAAAFVVKELNDLKQLAERGAATARVDLDADQGFAEMALPLPPEAAVVQSTATAS